MQFTQRKLLFKAWNRETRLLMRLNHIDCIKGELFRKDHILLQFTGHHDQHQEEIYEMDVILIGKEKFVVVWDGGQNRWNLTSLGTETANEPFLRKHSAKAIRICSYFESERSTNTI